MRSFSWPTPHLAKKENNKMRKRIPVRNVTILISLFAATTLLASPVTAQDKSGEVGVGYHFNHDAFEAFPLGFWLSVARRSPGVNAGIIAEVGRFWKTETVESVSVTEGVSATVTQMTFMGGVIVSTRRNGASRTENSAFIRMLAGVSHASASASAGSASLPSASESAFTLQLGVGFDVKMFRIGTDYLRRLDPGGGHLRLSVGFMQPF